MRIHSPMVSGSGAIAVHERLAAALPGYRVRSYPPQWQYLPPAFLALRDRTADIVHTTADQGAFPVTPGQALIVTLHNFVLDRYMEAHSSFLQRLHYRSDLRWLTRQALRRADVVTAVSAFTADLVAAEMGIERQAIQVIPNGVDIEHFRPAAAPENPLPRILVVGNASRRKGTHWLGEIALRLQGTAEITCTLSPAEARQWDISTCNVTAIGKRGYAEMPQLYREHDILLMPTVREGFGLAVAEAMACGLPVVASANSTMPELVEDGRGGYLCPTGDIDAYAGALHDLAGDAARRRRMGEFNRQRVEQRYTLEAMLDAYRSVFTGLRAGG